MRCTSVITEWYKNNWSNNDSVIHCAIDRTRTGFFRHNFTKGNDYRLCIAHRVYADPGDPRPQTWQLGHGKEAVRVVLWVASLISDSHICFYQTGRRRAFPCCVFTAPNGIKITGTSPTVKYISWFSCSIYKLRIVIPSIFYIKSLVILKKLTQRGEIRKQHKSYCYRGISNSYLIYLNFHSLEVVSRYRDPQLQVSKNYLFNLRPTICKSKCLNSHFIPNISDLVGK